MIASIEPGAAIAIILAIGVGGQLLTSRLPIPSILVLLPAGVAVGGLIDPDELLGDLLFPLVSLGVGILLFEGGFGLRWSKIGEQRQPIVRLVTVGVLVTWLIGWATAAWLLDLSTDQAVLIGAILTVSGPTVVVPLLRSARAREPSASILHWEGILIDPVGATLAIVVLDAILEDRGPARAVLRILVTATSGIGVGLLAALVLGYTMYHHWIPDRLQVPATLTAVVGAFAVANLLADEAGLFATTVLGLTLANQRRVAMAHISEFNENLGSLVLGALFVLLGARVDIDEIIDQLGPSLLLTAVLVFVARPLAVELATMGTGISRRHRLFLSWMAPRGIVAAAVSSLFALELTEHDIDPGPLVAMTFTVVVLTVVLYGITASTVVDLLRIKRTQAGGIAIIGAPHFAVDLAATITDLDATVLVVTPDEERSADAALRGQLVFGGRLDSDDLHHALDAAGIGSALAMSGAAYLDSYGIQRVSEHLGRANVFRIPPEGDDQPELAGADMGVSGRRLLPPEIDHEDIEALLVEHGGFGVRTAETLLDSDEMICIVDEDHRVTIVAGRTGLGERDRAVVLPGVADVVAAKRAAAESESEAAPTD